MGSRPHLRARLAIGTALQAACVPVRARVTRQRGRRSSLAIRALRALFARSIVTGTLEAAGWALLALVHATLRCHCAWATRARRGGACGTRAALRALEAAALVGEAGGAAVGAIAARARRRGAFDAEVALRARLAAVLPSGGLIRAGGARDAAGCVGLVGEGAGVAYCRFDATRRARLTACGTAKADGGRRPAPLGRVTAGRALGGYARAFRTIGAGRALVALLLPRLSLILAGLAPAWVRARARAYRVGGRR